MTIPMRNAIVLVLLAAPLLLPQTALPQEERTDPSSVLDTVNRWLKSLGEKTEEWIKPRVGNLDGNGGVDWRGLATSARDFQKNYPVRPNVVVVVSSEFGEIRVDAWENPVVRVRAEISVGAETVEVADEIVDAINIDVTELADRVEVSTKYPDTRDRGKVAIEVNYAITVPANASVLCSNNFGDTIVHGTRGTVAVDSRFGVVDLRDLSGAVSVRAQGEFPLNASGLRNGGSFELQSTQAEFVSVSGSLHVSNFMGSVTLRELAPESDLDVTSQSGPIHVYVPENSKPDIAVTTLYGAIQSDVPVERSSQGNLSLGRVINLESPQKLTLHASFATVYVHQEGLKPSPAAPAQNGGEYVTRGVEESAELTDDMRVRVNATLGDVRIEGVDSNMLEVKATKVVRMQIKENAEKAIEALGLRIEPVDGNLTIATAVRDNMEALGCTHYRVDLVIRCPRTAPIEIHAQSGYTSIEGMASAIDMEQGKGTVTVSHCKRDDGAFEVDNESGDIIVSDCQGPMTLTSQQGTIKTTNVYGKQTLTANLGKVLVDTPKGEVTVRGRGGDVNILALDGVLGEYNVQVERGNLELVIPKTADAELWVTTKNGIPDSAVPLTGTMERGLYQGKGQLNSAQYRVDLTTDGGNVYIYWPAE
ncbi:MAG: DUF4097 family beta strand repeat protein [Candidatus Hydrogenedentes bacterium]|nr:DUF4097 family beta strand repeat protein [Candidatus Hydrogenedentota bacterium]